MKRIRLEHGIVGLPAGMALVSVTSPSWAHHGHTRDPKCSFEAPLGATVDSEGNVSKDGASVDHFDFTRATVVAPEAGTRRSARTRYRSREG
jgi:hypothetical protein